MSIHMWMSVDIDPGVRISRASYRLETVPILRQRLSVAMGIFVFFMGVGTCFEATYFPERARLAIVLYGVEALIAIAGTAACWLPRMRDHAGAIAALMTVVLAGCINGYHAAVHAQAERVATVLGCVLNILSVTLPWGWIPQTTVTLGSFVTFAIAGPRFVTQDVFAIPLVVLAAVGTTSIWGAFFLDRYRFEAFRRTALETEEAQIAAALAHVGETLSRHLGEADVLERVNRLAIDVVGCDFSSLFLFDERHGVFRLASNVGSRPEIVAELAQLEFATDSLPLIQALRPGEIIAIHDAGCETLVPPELNRRLELASALYVPVARGARITGVLVAGYRTRTGAFSERERRLVVGIAHATAITLENGRLIADLQSANRLKSEFVATMSHELRTPLNVIMGYTEMLADRVFDPSEPEWNATITRIQEHSVELLELVNATLDMGRLESGRETVVVGEVDLDRLLADLARELKPLVPPGVVHSWTNALGGRHILSDSVKLKTILKNLMGNALKFTSAGSVHVDVRIVGDPDGDDELAFAVYDTGIGIASEHAAMIFDMFRQVDSSSTRRFSGVGLGLHIAQRLVELLNGTIRVESTLGVGSTFTITIPLRLANGPACATEPRAAVR